MKIYILWAILLLSIQAHQSWAYDLYSNPCQNMNIQSIQEANSRIPQDPNWNQIYTDNMKQLIRACQEYEIKKVQTETSYVY